MRRRALLALLFATGGCGGVESPPNATAADDVRATLVDGVEVECREITADDCDQAVSAIVNGVPYGENVVAVQIGPLEEPLDVTPAPPWAASARAAMVDGFVYELVIVQDARPGPMVISFAQD
jgi:hypothetical protein